MVSRERENKETRETTVSNHHIQNGNIPAYEDNNTVQQRYYIIYTSFQIIGILLILSVFFWLQYCLGGFSISETRRICNWHPMLMTISFTYLFGNSILHFRNFRNTRKRKLKMQHAIIHSCIIILGILGLWAGLNSNIIANPPIPKFYSLHSWLGIVTVVMFFFQFLSGFISYLYPEISQQYKEELLPYHIFFGILTFVLSIITSVLGFNEKIVFALKQQCKCIPAEGIFLNFVGMILILYSVIVVYIVIKPDYKRSPKPEETNGHIQGEIIPSHGPWTVFPRTATGV